MKKVLHINSYSVFNTLFSNLYMQQKSIGLEFVVYEFAPYGAEKVSVPLSDALNDVIIRDYNHPSWYRYIFPLKHCVVYKSCRNILQQYGGFSLVHAHSLFSNGYIAYKYSKQYGIPYIVTVRNTDVNGFFRTLPFMRPLGVEILKNASRVVFLSASYRDDMINKYVPNKLKKRVAEKAVVIPNGIDDFWHGMPFAKSTLLKTTHLNILTVGAINQNKNQTSVAKALKSLEKDGITVKYTIVGNAKDESVLNALEQYPFVEIVPPQPKEKLIDYYRKADIFILASISESFGLVYAEALSQSLPIIYTKNQGFDRQFEEGFVGYSTKTDPASIANAIVAVISKYNTIQSNCINASRCFDWKQVASSYERMYDELIAKG